jgi:hypothetical protein
MDRIEMRKQPLVQVCKRLAHGEFQPREMGVKEHHVHSRYIPLRRRERITANVPEPEYLGPHFAVSRHQVFAVLSSEHAQCR